MDPETASIEERFRTIRQWAKGDHRAPHKPLLLLLTLGRLQRGEPRLMPYREIREPFEAVLRQFAPPVSRLSPQAPFYRLSNDAGGIWELEAAPGPEFSSYKGGPSSGVLCDRETHAGFPSDLHRRLLGDPSLVNRLVRAILEAHFPASIHEDIGSALGLELSLADVVSPEKRRRDPAFRMSVLNAYQHRCAVCGFGVRLDGQTQAVEAAHVRWHSHDGPSEVDNGLALCSLHHKILDLGLISFDESRKVLVSGRVSGEGMEAAILRFANQPLPKPSPGKPPIAREYIQWHQREVFKGDSLHVA